MQSEDQQCTILFYNPVRPKSGVHTLPLSKAGESRKLRVQTQRNYQKTKYHASNEHPIRDEVEQFGKHFRTGEREIV